MSKKSTKKKQNNGTEEMKGILAKWNLYAEMTDVFPILRRYFVMNAFDGVLTALGLVIASYLTFTTNINLGLTQTVTQYSIITQGISVTFAISISGFIGAYLSEKAEYRKVSLEQKRVMMLPTDEDGDDDPLSDETVIKLREEDYYPKVELDAKEASKINGEIIEHEDVDPKPLEKKRKKLGLEKKDKEEEIEEKSLSEKADLFASVLLAMVDGLAPGIGSLIGIIPFLLAPPSFIIFVWSFILEIPILFGLGAFLAKVTDESVLKNGLLMIFAGVLTAFIATLIQTAGGS
ncbi:MAG: hypothetical protein GY870_07690 [archaeon]|nr:hypothetical protein [archaeon]